MRIVFFFAIIVVILLQTVPSCGPSGPATFCDTTCLKDSLKFTMEENPLKPYVYISTKDCKADTVIWSYGNMETNRKMKLMELLNTTVEINKDYITAIMRDTMYAWVILNDCATGRGFQVKLPYSKSEKLTTRSSGVNSFDPKFSVEKGLLAYSDRGNLFVEDAATGKQAMMTFGERVEIDYNKIHDKLDSVNITRTRVWAKVKIGDEWKEIEKTIELK